ncbi:MAG: hypothetical protein ACFLMY_05975 [Candidatus Brachytrichaceae bacterium NZ_4S206]
MKVREHVVAELSATIAAGGSVLAIEAGALALALGAGSVHELAAPPQPGDAVPMCDVALLGALGGAAPLDVARSVVPRVRPGGVVAFVLPTPRAGLKGATSSLLAMFRRQAPVLLEELCEALLIAGLDEVSARELDDASGTSLVWGRVRG